MVIKTGCSASLVGLHEACRALQSGDCTAAIVAGTSLIMGPTTTAAMTQEGIISPEGSCKTFDAKADGFARAEAINAVYIKRLDDAIRDNNPIRAVIRNTGTNSDGRSQGLMAPNGKSQEALMRRVYSEAGLNPRDTAFVEVTLAYGKVSCQRCDVPNLCHLVSRNWHCHRRSYRDHSCGKCIWRKGRIHWLGESAKHCPLPSVY
jgi:acyl transferase domain-containing protein